MNLLWDRIVLCAFKHTSLLWSFKCQICKGNEELYWAECLTSPSPFLFLLSKLQRSLPIVFYNWLLFLSCKLPYDTRYYTFHFVELHKSEHLQESVHNIINKIQYIKTYLSFLFKDSIPLGCIKDFWQYNHIIFQCFYHLALPPINS